MLKEYGVKCTSYMVGLALLQNPEVGQWLEREGCEIASHGWRWVDRSEWTVDEEVANIRRTIAALKDLSATQQAPRGWYYGNVATRAGARSRALVAQVFREEGLELKYYSDDYSDDLPHWCALCHASALYYGLTDC